MGKEKDEYDQTILVSITGQKNKHGGNISSSIGLNLRGLESGLTLRFSEEFMRAIYSLSDQRMRYEAMAFPCRGAEGTLEEVTALAIVDKEEYDGPPRVRCPRLQPEVRYLSSDGKESTAKYEYCRFEEKEVTSPVKEEELAQAGLKRCPFHEHRKLY